MSACNVCEGRAGNRVWGDKWDPCLRCDGIGHLCDICHDPADSDTAGTCTGCLEEQMQQQYAAESEAEASGEAYGYWIYEEARDG